MKIYLNGKLIPEKKAVVSVRDRGFLYGDGVYETLRVYDGIPFALPEHWERLVTSLQMIYMRAPLTRRGFDRVVAALVRANHVKDGIVRLTVTRGPGPHGFDPSSARTPTVVITCVPFTPPAEIVYRTGIRAAVVSVRRNSPRAVPPAAKTTNCLNGILAKIESLDLDAQEGLMLDERGFLAEGTVTNIFAVSKGKLYTPKLDGALLAGVTRDEVVHLARKAGIPVVESHLSPAFLRQADEIFLTSTLIEIMPVRELVFHTQSRGRATRHRVGRPGPVAHWLRALFSGEVRLRNAKLRQIFRGPRRGTFSREKV